jgi:ribosomal protein S7
MEIKNKLLNHLTLSGKKETGEKNLIKSIKKIQKNSLKSSEKIFQLALIYSTPIFKLHKIKNKKKKKRASKFKEIPGFIHNKNSRTSMAIKFILNTTKKNSLSQSFYLKLNSEILDCAKNKSIAVEAKNNLQKDILTKKRYFLYYRW